MHKDLQKIVELFSQDVRRARERVMAPLKQKGPMNPQMGTFQQEELIEFFNPSFDREKLTEAELSRIQNDVDRINSRLSRIRKTIIGLENETVLRRFGLFMDILLTMQLALGVAPMLRPSEIESRFKKDAARRARNAKSAKGAATDEIVMRHAELFWKKHPKFQLNNNHTAESIVNDVNAELQADQANGRPVADSQSKEAIRKRIIKIKAGRTGQSSN